jgi:3D (Asp-Asp-Asp) domain-containing protein
MYKIKNFGGKLVKYVFIIVFIVTFILFNVNDSYCKKNKKVVRELIMESTAYCDGEVTATGTKPSIGTVAADSSIIPSGTEMFIEGYGFGIVEDTGSSIVGNKIDVFHPSREWCYEWGRRKVKVKIYERN